MLLLLLLRDPHPNDRNQRCNQLAREREPPNRPQPREPNLPLGPSIDASPDGLGDAGEDGRREVLVRDQQAAGAPLVGPGDAARDEDGGGGEGQVRAKGHERHARQAEGPVAGRRRLR